jgi:hypothetical protein
MAFPPTPDWYIDVDGKKMGPFTLIQIEGFLREGKILVPHSVTTEIRVSSAHVENKWYPLHQILNAEDRRSIPLPDRPAPHAPLKPQEPPRVESDPTMSLFDALQAAKERSNNSTPRASEPSPLAKRDPSAGVERAAVAVAALAIVGGMVYGTEFILSKPAVDGSPTAEHTHGAGFHKNADVIVAPPNNPPGQIPAKSAILPPTPGKPPVPGQFNPFKNHGAPIPPPKSVQEAHNDRDHDRDADRDRDKDHGETRDRDRDDRDRDRERDREERDRERAADAGNDAGHQGAPSGNNGPAPANNGDVKVNGQAVDDQVSTVPPGTPSNPPPNQ